MNSGFEAVHALEKEYKKPPSAREYDANHYYWFGAEDIPVQHLHIPGGWVRRCRVTPVVRAVVWEARDLLKAVPEIMLEGYFRDFDPVARQHALAAYAILPGYIAESLESEYGATKAQPESLKTGIQGVVELHMLRGWEPSKVEALNIDGLFFPEFAGVRDDEVVDDLPKTYRELRERIQNTQTAIKSGEISVDPKYKDLLVAVGNLMLDSLGTSEINDQLILDSTHASFERSKSDKNEKATYDARDFRALRRLEQTRRDEALSRMANQSNTLHDVVIDLLKDRGKSGKSEVDVDLLARFGAIVAEQLKEKSPEKSKTK